MNDGQIIAIIGLERFTKFEPRSLAVLKKLHPTMLEEALKHGIILSGERDPRMVETITFGKLETFVNNLVKATQGDTHWFAEPDPDGFPACYSEMMSDVDDDWRLSTEGIFFRSRCRMLWLLCEAAQHEKIRKFKNIPAQNYTDAQKQAIEDVLTFMEHTKTELPPPPEVRAEDPDGNVIGRKRRG